MFIQTFVVTVVQQNARLVACEKTKRAICVDPGDGAVEISQALERAGLTLQAIALTHAHMDHIGGVAQLKELHPQAEIILHEADEPLYRALPEQPAWLGIPRAEWAALGMVYDAPPKIDRCWQDEEVYAVGDLHFLVRHCPGHAPGHVVLFEEQARKLFAGDCLFAGSIGRTDLPGGSMAELMDSLLNKIMPLGDDVAVYCGHGADTRLGHERLHNPFLQNAYASGA